ncbi:MAG: TetR family transcriptional regulator [Syntrophorhabdaceae bacterium]|nr:TetR family transcriptional regulator [Syntrophorhabdaceae bacterium]
MPKKDPDYAGNKRNRILQAAIEVFSQKGFFGSKVSEIARASGVADGTIYIYFKSKDDLLIALFEEKMDEIVVEMRRKVNEYTNPLDKLKAYIENHMKLLEGEAGLIEVLQVELRQSSKFMKDYTPVKFFEYLDILSGIIEEGKEAGLFRLDMNVRVARRIVFGAMDELSRTYILSKRKNYHPSVTASEVFNLLADGLRAPGAENSGHV